MAQTIPERLRWAVETLAVAPADQLLEIGCGAGGAVSFVCERLGSGTITALDRSDVMLRMATRRNQQHIAAGKAVFQAVALDQADFGGRQFNKIFAFNVSAFWTPPATGLALLKPLLMSGGAVYLFYQPPQPGTTQQVADQLVRLLQQHGFSIKDVRFKDLTPAPAMCVIAEAVFP